MSTITRPEGATRLEIRRLEVEAKRLANTARFDALAAERELARLDDEEAYEDARAKAYEDPAIGPERCLGGSVEAAGFALFKWPDDGNWRHFMNRGVLKPNGLTTELADDLTCRCVLFARAHGFTAATPIEHWREMMRRNPTASFQAATLIKEAMDPSEQEAGKGLRSSRGRR